VVLLCPSPSDAAYATVVKVAQAATPELPVEILLTRPEAHHNRKVAQLTVGLARSEEPIVITRRQ
jgi:hypothetical protein